MSFGRFIDFWTKGAGLVAIRRLGIPHKLYLPPSDRLGSNCRVASEVKIDLLQGCSTAVEVTTAAAALVEGGGRV